MGKYKLGLSKSSFIKVVNILHQFGWSQFKLYKWMANQLGLRSPDIDTILWYVILE